MFQMPFLKNTNFAFFQIPPLGVILLGKMFFFILTYPCPLLCCASWIVLWIFNLPTNSEEAMYVFLK